MKKLLDIYNDKYNLIKQYKVLIIANVREKTNNFKSLDVKTALENEFFSHEEFNEIYDAIKSLNLGTKIYYNELDFIYDILEEKYNLKEIIVFNFARNGIVEGKKSLIPSFCDLLNIKYTSCNAFIQSLCRNKYVWGNVLFKEKLPILDNILIRNGVILNHTKVNFKNNYICKPTSESSSIGIHSPQKIEQILSKNTNSNVIVQKVLEGIEFEVPFFELNNEIFILEPTKIVYQNNILNENLSLNNDYYYLDLDISIQQKEKYKKIVKNTVKLLNIRKYGRIDFKMDKLGKAYIIDIATLPYITKKSSFNYQFNKLGFSYEDIFKCLIVCALLDANQNIEDPTL